MEPAVPLNLVAVLLAGAANFILGFLWYGPLFGKQWIKMMKMDPKKIAEAQKKGMAGMWKQMLMGLVSSIVTAFVLAHSLVFAMDYLGITGVGAALQGAFWNWLGFTVPVTLNASLWEERSWGLWFFNSAYYLVGFIIMSIILVMMPAM